MPSRTKPDTQPSKNKFRLRVSIRARGLGDILVPRPCFFCVQVGIGNELEASTEWLPAPIYRAPRHELDFGFVKITMEEDQLNSVRHSRAPLKLNLLTASKPSSPVPIVAGFVLVDSRSLTSNVGQGLNKQWYRLQSAKCKGSPPELNVGCKLQWASTDSPSYPTMQVREPTAVPNDDDYNDDKFEQISNDDNEESVGIHPDVSETVSDPKKEEGENGNANVDISTPNVSSQPSNEPPNPSLKKSSPPSPDIKFPSTSEFVPPKFTLSGLPTLQTAPSSLRQYRISVDLCAVRDLTKAGDIYARYMYPLFDTQAPVVTHPPVHVDINTEVGLPNSFCAFEFCMNQERLESALSRDPLVVEIVFKEDQNESVLGSATLNLTQLLTAPSSPMGPGQIRAIDQWVPVFTHVNEDPDDIVLSGSIRCSLFLEDLGTVGSTSSTVNDGKTGYLAEFSRGSEAYHVAWELESWKRKQQEAFKSYLAKVEEERKQQLEAKLQEMIDEKTMYFAQKEKSVLQMEKKLQQTLYELRNQEKTLRQQEEEHAKLKESLIRDHELKLKEDAALIKSLKRQHEQEVGLLSREKANLLERLNEMERLYQEQTELLLGIKRKFAASATGKLQEELAEVKLRLQAADEELCNQKSKEQRLQSQLVACLNELARLRQAMEVIENERLDRERLELQRLRVQLMAKEREKELGSDRQQLRSIRDEIRKMLMKEPDSMTPTASTENMKDPLSYIDSRKESVATEYISAEHERLRKERLELLQTGIYTEDHDLIKAIDRRIMDTQREQM